MMDAAPQPASSAAHALFTELTGAAPVGLWSAPGRVNLIGEHTDYNDGFVLPFAIEQRTHVALGTRSDGRIRVISTVDPVPVEVPLVDLDGALDELGLSDEPIAVLKVDVEGFEPAVIAGAQRALGRTQAVVLEVAPRLYRDAGFVIEDMLRILRANGFSPFTLESGALRPDRTDWSDQDEVHDLVWLKGTPA